MLTFYVYILYLYINIKYMRLITIIALSLIISSCATKKHNCDAYGYNETVKSKIV